MARVGIVQDARPEMLRGRAAPAPRSACAWLDQSCEETSGEIDSGRPRHRTEGPVATYRHSTDGELQVQLTREENGPQRRRLVRGEHGHHPILAGRRIITAWPAVCAGRCDGDHQASDQAGSPHVASIGWSEVVPSWVKYREISRHFAKYRETSRNVDCINRAARRFYQAFGTMWHYVALCLAHYHTIITPESHHVGTCGNMLGTCWEHVGLRQPASICVKNRYRTDLKSVPD